MKYLFKYEAVDFIAIEANSDCEAIQKVKSQTPVGTYSIEVWGYDTFDTMCDSFIKKDLDDATMVKQMDAHLKRFATMDRLLKLTIKKSISDVGIGQK